MLVFFFPSSLCGSFKSLIHVTSMNITLYVSSSVALFCLGFGAKLNYKIKKQTVVMMVSVCYKSLTRSEEHYYTCWMYKVSFVCCCFLHEVSFNAIIIFTFFKKVESRIHSKTRFKIYCKNTSKKFRKQPPQIKTWPNITKKVNIHWIKFYYIYINLKNNTKKKTLALLVSVIFGILFL